MKYLKVHLLNQKGNSIFQEWKVPEESYSIRDVELVDHQEKDVTLDLKK